MFGKLTSLIGGGYALPYNVGEPYSSSWGCWTHHAGTSKDDQSPVSVFRIAARDKNDPKLVAARNGVKRLKLVRGVVWRHSAGMHAPRSTPAVRQPRCPTPLASGVRTAHLHAHRPVRQRADANLRVCACCTAAWARGGGGWAQLKHPNMLAFKDTAEVEERGEVVIFLVTEAVQPLVSTLDKLDLSEKERCVARRGAHLVQ